MRARPRATPWVATLVLILLSPWSASQATTAPDTIEILRPAADGTLMTRPYYVIVDTENTLGVSWATLTSPGQQVTLDSIPFEDTYGGTWRPDREADGNVTINATVKMADGRLLSTTRTVLVDTTPPDGDFISPRDRGIYLPDGTFISAHTGVPIAIQSPIVVRVDITSDDRHHVEFCFQSPAQRFCTSDYEAPYESYVLADEEGGPLRHVLLHGRVIITAELFDTHGNSQTIRRELIRL